ncbi:MAG: MerR family transcriptional regulator [Dehalococcoidia bacterium]|nr:MerR family transcriptional regulator [Dehalococcoidia bacterium]
MRGYMQIGDVAQRTGLTQRTLRFYEEKGLFRPPARQEGGFRLYSEEDVHRIEHIVQLKQVFGFTLDDIKKVLDAEDSITEFKAQFKELSTLNKQADALHRVISIAEAQIALIDGKSEQLKQVSLYWQQKLEWYRSRIKQLDENAQVLSARAPVR